MRPRGRTALAFMTATALLATLPATACQGPNPAAQASPSTDATASASVSPSASPTTQPADPAVTADVCTLARVATDTTTRLYLAQVAAIDEAVARGDQAALVTATETINRQLVNLAATMTQLADRPVTPELRTVLTNIATALTGMTDVKYIGTMADIGKELAEFARALTQACTPPGSASPTPSA